MIQAIELAEFTEKNGWIVIDKDDDFVRYLTPSGQKVIVFYYRDGSIEKVYP